MVITWIRSFLRATSPISKEKCFVQTQGNKQQVELKAVLPAFFWVLLS